MSVSTNWAPGMFEASKQLAAVRRLIVKDARRALKAGESKGFPQDPDDYTLYLTNAGRRSKRKLSTVNPDYLKIGTAARPLEFLFTAQGGLEDAKRAAADAMRIVRERAPWRTGNYIVGIKIFANGSETTAAKILTTDLDKGAEIVIAATAPYSTIIEAGFYRGYYETQRLRQGIMYWTTQQVRASYGAKISIKFGYLSLGGGTVPAITIAAPGQFYGADAKPGSWASKKARRLRRKR